MATFALLFAFQAIAAPGLCAIHDRNSTPTETSIGQSVKTPKSSSLVQSTIEIWIHSPAQLFDPLDPSPNARRALSGDVASYILALARERPAQEQLRLLIHGPGSLQRHASGIAQAIPEHFRLAHANGQRSSCGGCGSARRHWR